MSHLALLEHLKANSSSPEEVVLILEDDVTLDRWWHEMFVEAMPHLPHKWDVVHVCYWGGVRVQDVVNRHFYRTRFVPVRKSNTGKIRRKEKKYMGACGYMIQPKRGTVLDAFYRQAQTHGISSSDVTILNDSTLVRYAM